MQKLAGALSFLLLGPGCKADPVNLGQDDPPLAVITIGAAVQTKLGIEGALQEAMSTSFQPAPWQYQFFDLHPDAAADLKLLNPQHVHIQAVDEAVPWWSDSTQTPADWHFDELDAMVPQIMAADPEALFQIAVAPPFLAGSLMDTSLTLDAAMNEFAMYCGYLVEYYNRGGIVYPADAGMITVPAPSGTLPISWWGIFGDFNTNNLAANNYQALYDRAVRQMILANGDAGALHFSAFEYSDVVNGQGQMRLQLDLSTFLASESAPIDALSLHVFSAPERHEPDQAVFQTVPVFANGLRGVYAQLADAGGRVTSVPVWVTQNNVDSDYPVSGQSNQTGETFVNDTRGTDAFFAGWRPYVFSQFGKAGNRALYHWDYTAGNVAGRPDTDLQNAEVDYESGYRFLSYWVDYWLAQMFPATDPPSLEILEGSEVDYSALGLEVLATKNKSDGSVVIMVVDLAPEGAADAAGNVINGHGARRKVAVDASALGPFASGTLRLIDDPNADNTPASAPRSVDVTQPTITVDLPGYGVAFVKLLPRGAP